MRSQPHNEGELKELTVKIEKEIVEVFEKMSENTGISIDDLVLISMKRFRSSHADYEKVIPILD